MKTLSIIVMGLLLANSAYGQEVKYLEKGTPAPYTGYLITPDLEKEFRLMDKKLEFSTDLNTSYETLVKGYEGNEAILNRRIDICQKQNEELAKPKSDFGKVGTYLLGAATAILIMFAVQRVK